MSVASVTNMKYGLELNASTLGEEASNPLTPFTLLPPVARRDPVRSPLRPDAPLKYLLPFSLFFPLPWSPPFFFLDSPSPPPYPAPPPPTTQLTRGPPFTESSSPHTPRYRWPKKLYADRGYRKSWKSGHFRKSEQHSKLSGRHL